MEIYGLWGEMTLLLEMEILNSEADFDWERQKILKNRFFIRNLAYKSTVINKQPPKKLFTILSQPKQKL